MNAPLDKKLRSVKWGEFRIDMLFQKIKVNSLKYKVKDLPTNKTHEYCLPALTAGIENQGLNCYVPKTGATILKNVISISANGANTGATFYQSGEFTVLQDAYALKWVYDGTSLSDNQYLFITNSISKTVYGYFEWTNKAGWERIKMKTILLPITSDGKINFEFMESFIAELEAERIAKLFAYLKASGLDNYELTKEEKTALNDFNNDRISFAEFRFDSIFNNIRQGRRLKKEDHCKGDIPFVMSGTTNTGVVGCISNPVAMFPSNSITVDIFGNVFYRNFIFGAGDDTGVYWNDEQEYSKEVMLFFAASIGRALHGKYSYGEKLRSSQSTAFCMQLIAKDGKPDYNTMELLISAVQKLVIRDVVRYADRRVAAAKRCTMQ